MVAAILLHYVFDDPLPNRGTFGDPGSNSGADNFFFLLALNVFLFSPTCLVPHALTTYTAFLLGMYGCVLLKKKKSYTVNIIKNH